MPAVIGNLIAVLLVFLLVGVSVMELIKEHKKGGCGGCSGCCGSCAGCAKCPHKAQPQK